LIDAMHPTAKQLM